MRFKFPLENVRKHRKMQEDLAQRDVQLAQADLNEQMQILENLINEKSQARKLNFEKQSLGGAIAPALGQADEFVLGQDIRIDRQRKKVQEFERRVEELREILRQRAIEYKIIDSYRDKKKDEYKVEERKREQKNTDDLNVMRFKPEDGK